MSPLRHLAATALALLVFLGAAAAAAEAAGISFTAVNTRGTPLAGVLVYPAGSASWTNSTDAFGNGTLNDAAPGAAYMLARWGFLGTCPPPEGDGVLYTVPNPVPTRTTVVLPSSPGNSVQPQLDPDERWVIGLINQRRSQLGARPLYVSTVLSTIADRFADYSVTAGVFSHCAAGSTNVRASDGGYPDTAIGENLASRFFGRGAFDAWMASPAHRDNMLNPAYGVAGIGQYQGMWALELGLPCTPATIGYARCGMTSDIGDPNDPHAARPASAPAPTVAEALRRARKKCRKRHHGKKRRKCLKRARARAEKRR